MKQIPSKEQNHTEKDLTLSLFAFALFAYLLQTPLKWSSAGRAGRGPEDRALQAGWMWVTAQQPVASSKPGTGHSNARLEPFPALLGWIGRELRSSKQTSHTSGEWFNIVSKSITTEYSKILLKKWSITPIWQLEKTQISPFLSVVAQNLGMNLKPPFCSTSEDCWLFHTYCGWDA